MLAITERLLIDEGLDWVFCDTNSMAFAAPANLTLEDFQKRVRKVCAWFNSLNPYEQPGSILKFEDQNFSLEIPQALKRKEGVGAALLRRDFGEALCIVQHRQRRRADHSQSVGTWPWTFAVAL